jgi:O-antigen biosynthesis protein
MHRSGTSLVSRLLNLLGVHLGPDHAVSKRGGDNPKGYWEHQSLVALNDEMLARFGGRWDEPPELPPSWTRDPRVEDLREAARHLLARDFAAEPLWGWKDPRTCLTLPFWQDLIGPMRYVVCVRNPAAVAASLARRNGMSFDRAERLWLLHVQASLAHTSGQPRMFVSYEDLVDDWRPALRRLAAFIGDPDPADDPRVHDAVSEFVEREMCHHRLSMEDVVGDARITFPTKAAYLDLVLRGHLDPSRYAGRVVTLARGVMAVAFPPGARRRGA